VFVFATTKYTLPTFQSDTVSSWQWTVKFWFDVIFYFFYNEISTILATVKTSFNVCVHVHVYHGVCRPILLLILYM